MERKKLSSKSHEKEHPSKKNAEGTSRRTKKSKVKPSKRILSSEETSSDESVNTDESRNEQAKLYSCATVGESSKSVEKLKVERIRPSTSERLQKGHISKQNVEEVSSSKGKTYKIITSREKSFSGEMMNAGSPRARPYPLHSRASSEDNSHIKASKKMERKRPSSSKSLRKIDLTKKNVEETSQPTQSSRGTYKSMDYCEDNSTEESRNDANPPTNSNFSATDVHNGRKEWRLPPEWQPLPPVKKNTESVSHKQTDSGDKLTNSFCPSIGNKSDAKDDRLDAGKFTQKSSTSEVLPDRRNLFKSGRSSPFSYWGKITHEIRHSKADEKREKGGTGVEDGACTRMDPKQLHKDWERFRDLKIQQDRKEKQSTSKTDDSEPQPQEDAFKSIKPMVNSEVDMKRKNDGTEAAGNAFAENSPKVVNNDIVKKEGEKTKDLTSRSKIDDAKDAGKMPTYGGSNENITDLKSSPIAAENTRGLKRLSDPSYVLKENRPRPSI